MCIASTLSRTVPTSSLNEAWVRALEKLFPSLFGIATRRTAEAAYECCGWKGLRRLSRHLTCLLLLCWARHSRHSPWRTQLQRYPGEPTASGQVIVGAGTQGGICGTCFTLESGVTISCAHRTETLFKPNPGFDACRVYVLEWGGRTTELKGGCLRLFPDYDACVIDGYHINRLGATRSVAANLAKLRPVTCEVMKRAPRHSGCGWHVGARSRDLQTQKFGAPRKYIFAGRLNFMSLTWKAGI